MSRCPVASRPPALSRRTPDAQQMPEKLAEIRLAILSEHGADLLALFEAWDYEGDGKIGRNEFVDGVLSLDVGITRDESLATFDKFDVDRTGSLTMRELKVQIDIARRHSCETHKVGASAHEAISLVYSTAYGLDWCHLRVEALLMLATLLVGPVCVAFGLMYDAMLPDDERDAFSVFPSEATSFSIALAHGLSAPVVATVMSLLCARHLSHDGERSVKACARSMCSMRTVFIWVGTLSFHSYCAALSLVKQAYEPSVHYYFRLSYALAFLNAMMFVIMVIDRAMFTFVERDDEAFRTSQLQRTQLAMMKDVSRFGKPEHDGSYGFLEHSRAADVLYQMWSILRVIVKAAGCIMFIVFYLSATTDATDSKPSFRWAEILFLLVLVASGSLVTIGLSGASVSNVLHLAISKPFFLGDIVHVHSAIQPGGIGQSITGFVENITFSHVVIRAFDVKQVWIAHDSFQSLTVSNWTRRPNKCVNMRIGIRATDSPKAVKAFVKFVKSWVDACSDVKQSGYKKIALTGVDPGYTVTIIFFTAVGASKKKMRDKMIVDVMEASRLLGLSIQPLDMPLHLTGAVGSSPEPNDESQEGLEHLLPKQKADPL